MEKKLGFGLMRLPLTERDNPKSVDQELFNKMADYFLESGFTYFDTAYPYHQGMSEAAMRKALVERHPRDSFLLADKMPVIFVRGPEDYQRIFDEQIGRCGVERFDYYLLHALGEKNYNNTVKFGGFEFVKKLKAEGKAGKIGFSFHDKADVLDRILTEHPEMEFVQLQINYVDWENETIESRKCYEAAARHGKPVSVMEPLKGGSLANISPEAGKLFAGRRPDMSAASWGIRYAASLENVFVVLSGMTEFEQLADNVSYMRDFEPLDRGELEIVEKAAGIIKSGIAVPCTACQYCVDGCPMNIPIPKYLALYNDQHQFGLRRPHRDYYINLIQDYGKACDCVECRQCETQCPQHIEIVNWLGKVSGIFDGVTDLA